MRVFYTPKHQLHDPGFEVTAGQRVPAYEVPSRATSILDALTADGRFTLEEAREFGAEPILAVHDEGLFRYLEGAWSDWRARGMATPAIMPDAFLHPAIREGMGQSSVPSSPCGQSGTWCFDTATPVVAGTYEAVRASVDVALTAADAALAGEASVYGLTRPPGHHAARAVFGGYCYFNFAAIATDWLARRTGEPVAVLDVDFHHGNGTQQIFYARGDVLYTSLHADPSITFPYFAGYAAEIGVGEGARKTFNQPLEAGTTNEQYLAALDRALERIVEHRAPFVVVSLGIDSYGLDPIGNFALTTPVYHEVGRRAAATGSRLVILQEGGYHVDHLGRNVREWLRGAEGRPPAFAAPGATDGGGG